MKDCLFCRIIAGEVPSQKVYEDERVLAFKDINPVAPVHVLVVPKQHLGSLSDAGEEELSLLGHLQLVAARLAGQTGVAPGGYRVVTNCGPDGGQTIHHLHLHLLGGREMRWPPG
ncbi:MAG: histidine triad nucleotide-binding protein [Syntrophomonadaceae bacterium]|nr:histidine triad nucleotide-binding protein [Syntrophomonadaceae bacterium]